MIPLRAVQDSPAYRSVSAPFRRDREIEHLGDAIRWSRDTLYPLHGLPLGLEYCSTTGTLELEDHELFFHPQVMPVPASTAQVLGARPGQPIVYFPRRSFDLWGARYFILPAVPDWASPVRGFASFLNKTDLVHPAGEVLYDTRASDGVEPWRIRQDWQLRRNRAAYPRAWIVHHARVRPPATHPEARADLMRTLVFMNDPIWTEPDRPVFDLRQSAIIETEDAEAIGGTISRTPVGPRETVTITRHEPQRVELEVSLDLPGFVILAETYYPGWRLTIGRPTFAHPPGQSARCAGPSCPRGAHTLVYTYDPASFRAGAIHLSGGARGTLVADLASPETGVRGRRAAKHPPGLICPRARFIVTKVSGLNTFGREGADACPDGYGSVCSVSGPASRRSGRARKPSA